MVKEADWKLVGPVDRLSDQDQTVAVFCDYNAEDRTVEVYIPTKMLGQIFDLPDKLSDRKVPTREVLLAMVMQADEQKLVASEGPTIIREKDVDMHAVKARFSAS
jgi:hypothetical protein